MPKEDGKGVTNALPSRASSSTGEKVTLKDLGVSSEVVPGEDWGAESGEVVPEWGWGAESGSSEVVSEKGAENGTVEVVPVAAN